MQENNVDPQAALGAANSASIQAKQALMGVNQPAIDMGGDIGAAQGAADRQPNESDIDVQMRMMNAEPFVQRIQEFYFLVKDYFGRDSKEYQIFKSLCYQINYSDNYEDPLLKIYEMMVGSEPLSKIFIELAPETFVTRMFPQIEQDLVIKFDNLVKGHSDPQAYETYHDIALRNMRGEITVKQFRGQLESLFKSYPDILTLMPTFFSETGDLTMNSRNVETKVSSESVQPASKTAKGKSTRKVEATAGTTSKSRAIGKKKTVDANEEESVQVDQQASVADKASKSKGLQNKLQNLPSQAATTVAAPQVKPIPEELKNFTKSDVSFFLEKMPAVLKSSDSNEFIKLFSLYLEGVLSQFEFYELAGDLMSPNSEDQFKQLQNIVSVRDNSRRLNNDLLRPLSEIDMTKFRQQDNVTPSYYRLPNDFPLPICSGRYTSKECQQTLNDRYASLSMGSENYKFKQRNAHEDLLFKNEDEMYQLDHTLIQLEIVVRGLDREFARAIEYEEEKKALPEGTKPAQFKIKHLSRQSLAFIDKFYLNSGQITHNVTKMIPGNPEVVIKTFRDRLSDLLKVVRKDKAKALEEWRSCCETNFFKSLDHRSFFFKEAQKKQLPGKKQFEELKKIASLNQKQRTLNQLKGGSSPHNEFFCTYSSFHLNSIQVYPEEALQAPELLQDSPMNLKDETLINQALESNNAHQLPQMRFLFHDDQILTTTFQLLMAGTRVGSNSVADRSKIENVLETICCKFFQKQALFDSIKKKSQQLQSLSDENISLISANQHSYYVAKAKEDYSFGAPEDEGHERQQSAQILQGGDKNTAMIVDSQQATASVLVEATPTPANKEDSSESKPKSQSSTEPSSIHLQASDMTLPTSDIQHSLLIPAFKEGYSVLFGTHQFYVLLKKIATVYERLVKAKDLITQKVSEDLGVHESTKPPVHSKNEVLDAIKSNIMQQLPAASSAGEETEKLKVVDGDKEIEKLRSQIKSLVNERFQMFLNAVVGTLSQPPNEKKMDMSIYEDFVRVLMGSEAYLLFVFDRLITQTLKYLPNFTNSDECSRSLYLYNRFATKERATNLNEHLYLTQFHNKMKDNNFQGNGIRLMYSPFSRIMSVNLFNLIPFSMSASGSTATQGAADFAGKATKNQNNIQSTFKSMSEKERELLVRELVYNKPPQSADDVEDKEGKEAEELSDPSERLKYPVFLNRNKRIMKEVRKELDRSSKTAATDTKSASTSGTLEFENGLAFRQLPQILKLQYDPCTEDVLIYKRRKTSELTEEKQFMNNYVTQLRFQDVLEKARKAQEEYLAQKDSNSESSSLMRKSPITPQLPDAVMAARAQQPAPPVSSSATQQREAAELEQKDANASSVEFQGTPTSMKERQAATSPQVNGFKQENQEMKEDGVEPVKEPSNQ